jgi:hypothetical protein
MAGVRGRSGGRNKLPVELHLKRGTFRRDRHAHLLTTPHLLASATGPRPVTTAATARVPEQDPETVPADETGHEFEQRMAREFSDWSIAELTLVKLAGQQLDRLHEIRAALAATGVVITGGRKGVAVQSALLRAERQTVTTFAGLLRQLNLKD